jgi:hypothetical protein
LLFNVGALKHREYRNVLKDSDPVLQQLIFKLIAHFYGLAKMKKEE